MSSPVISQADRCYYLLGYYRTRELCNPKQNNTAVSRKLGPESKLAKIFVESEENAILSLSTTPILQGRKCQEILCESKRCHALAGARLLQHPEEKVLVSKKAHLLDRDSINFFSIECCPGIAETSLDIFNANTKIVAKDFIGTPALSQEINNEFNREASTSDNGLTD